MAKVGTFVWATIPFAEGDGRKKIRPVLVLAKMRSSSGDVVYLGAGKYSATDKVRGAVEVVLSQSEAVEIGFDKEGVLRFSRDSLVAFLDRDVQSEVGHFSRLGAGKQEAIRRAAKAVRIEL